MDKSRKSKGSGAGLRFAAGAGSTAEPGAAVHGKPSLVGRGRAGGVVDGRERLPRGELERALRELEAANRDLKASNHELLLGNAALQAANRELERANAELRTARQAEFRMSADLENLLRLTQTATILLDRQGAVRLFTPAAAEIYDVGPADIGRPLSELGHRLRDAAPIPDLAWLLNREDPFEDEAQREDGRWFLRRVLAYRTPDGEVEGFLLTFTDVTSRRVSETARRESEARFRSIAETLPALVWMTDAAGQVTFVNNRWTETTGLSPQESLGCGWTKALHEDDVARILPMWEDACRREENFEAEIRYRAGEDGYRWHLARAEPVRDGQGRPAGWFGTSLDIHDRKQAEAALRDSEERLRLSQEAGGIGLWDWNLKTGEIYWSPKLREIIGQPPEVVATADNFQSFVHPDDRPKLAEAIKEALHGTKGSQFDAEWRVIRSDGSVIWLAGRGEVFRSPDGQPERLVGVDFDITDLRRVQEDLRDKARRLRLALSAAHMGHWSWDILHDKVLYSESCWEIIGLEPIPEMSWSRVSEIVDPRDRERVRLAVEDAVAGRAPYAIEYRIRRPSDGAEIWVSVNSQSVYGPDGQVVGMIGVLQDVTDRKHAEERQSLLIRELHHRVKNTLATVQAIVGSTARTASSIDEFYQAFVGRIVSLAQTHTLLTEDFWQTASLGQLLRNELGPYDDRHSERVVIEGPPVELTSDAAVPLGMAIHELTTNAAKHGALSVLTGRIEVRWTVREDPSGDVLRFVWTESGGPPVEAPKKQGFGSRLLQRVLTTQLQAEVSLDYDREGFRCTIVMPVPRKSDPYNSLRA